MIEKLNQHFSFTNPASIHDEEALTALELAGRQGAKINEVINDQNALRVETESEIKTMKEVQIPKEVRDEVQEHIEDGTFDRQIYDALDGIDQRVDTLLGSVTEGSTTMDAEVIDLRTDFTFKAWTGDTPRNGYNARRSLMEAFNYVPFSHGAIMNGIHDLSSKDFTDVGVYSFAGDVAINNLPESMIGLPYSGGGNDSVLYLKVEATDRYRVEEAGFIPRGIQTVFTLGFEKVYQRFFRCTDPLMLTYEFDPWRPANVSDTFRTISVPCDLNTIVEEDRYIIATGDCENTPAKGYGGLLIVTKLSHGWVIQEYFGIHTFPVRFWRVANCPSQTRENYAADLNITWGEWIQPANLNDVENSLNEAKRYTDTKIAEIPSGGGGGGGSAPKSNEGQKIVFIGDSIIGAVRDASSVTSHVANMTGATVYNGCIGGTRLFCRNYGEPWDALDIDMVINAIINDSLDTLHEPAEFLENERGESNILAPVETLMSIDWNTVDILVISGGMNDHLSENNPDDYHTEWAETSNYYQLLENLGKKYPNIKIVFVAPPPYARGRTSVAEWGYELLNDNVTSEELVFNALTRWVDFVKNMARSYGAPCVDLHNVGVNVWNVERWLDDPSVDPVHPNALGRKEIAKAISHTLAGM